MNKSEPKFLTSSEWHLYHVSQDPEFILEISKISKTESLDAYLQIAKKYRITRSDVYLIRNNVVQTAHTRGWINYEQAIKRFVIIVSPDITKDEFLELWKRLSKNKELLTKLTKRKSTKRKPPVDHKLIYAVFKQEQKSVSFEKTFDLYIKGKLPYLIGEVPNPKYVIKDDLRHYYDSHKPDNNYYPDLA